MLTSLEYKYCIPMIRCADTHTLVTGDTPFPVLIHTKFGDVTKYCRVVPTLAQGISVVPPFPADPAALVLGPVLRSFSPMMKTISRGHAVGLETPPGPSRVQDRLPQHNPFPHLLPPLRSAAQKGFLLLTCTGALESSSEISEADPGLHFLPAGAGWIAESHQPSFQDLGAVWPQQPSTQTFLWCTRDMKMDFFSLPFFVQKDFLSWICHFGLFPFRWHCYHFQERSLLGASLNRAEMGQDCQYHWVNKPEQVGSDPDQGSGNICCRKSCWCHSSSHQSVVRSAIPAQHKGSIGKKNI